MGSQKDDRLFINVIQTELIVVYHLVNDLEIDQAKIILSNIINKLEQRMRDFKSSK